MKTIVLEVSEEQFSRLIQAAELRHQSLSGMVKDRLVDLLDEPTDPFDPRPRRGREWEESFQRRIA